MSLSSCYALFLCVYNVGESKQQQRCSLSQASGPAGASRVSLRSISSTAITVAAPTFIYHHAITLCIRTPLSCPLHSAQGAFLCVIRARQPEAGMVRVCQAGRQAAD